VKDPDKEQDLCCVSELKSDVSPGFKTTVLSMYEFALMLREGSQATCITDESEQLLNSYEASDCDIIAVWYNQGISILYFNSALSCLE
jgi:hypothetical protein